MKTRAYSTEEKATWIFADVLNYVGRRGWYCAGPTGEDGKSLLYASFQIHPEDADRVAILLEKAIREYGGGTEWVLQRHQHNRFFLCPVQVALLGEELGNSSKAVAQLRKTCPALARQAAADLGLLSDFLFDMASPVKGSH